MLGALGKREDDANGGTCALPSSDVAAVRRQAVKVAVESAAAAIIATAIVWVL